MLTDAWEVARKIRSFYKGEDWPARGVRVFAFKMSRTDCEAYLEQVFRQVAEDAVKQYQHEKRLARTFEVDMSQIEARVIAEAAQINPEVWKLLEGRVKPTPTSRCLHDCGQEAPCPSPCPAVTGKED